MKKLLSIILALALFAAAFGTISVSAEENADAVHVVVKNGTFNTTDGAPWQGTWEIEKSSIDGVTCLCASEGISSIEGGKSDIIGTLKYYFNYGEDGKINILKTDFEKA